MAQYFQQGHLYAQFDGGKIKSLFMAENLGNGGKECLGKVLIQILGDEVDTPKDLKIAHSLTGRDGILYDYRRPLWQELVEFLNQWVNLTDKETVDSWIENKMPELIQSMHLDDKSLFLLCCERF